MSKTSRQLLRFLPIQNLAACGLIVDLFNVLVFFFLSKQRSAAICFSSPAILVYSQDILWQPWSPNEHEWGANNKQGLVRNWPLFFHIRHPKKKNPPSQTFRAPRTHHNQPVMDQNFAIASHSAATTTTHAKAGDAQAAGSIDGKSVTKRLVHCCFLSSSCHWQPSSFSLLCLWSAWKSISHGRLQSELMQLMVQFFLHFFSFSSFLFGFQLS